MLHQLRTIKDEESQRQEMAADFDVLLKNLQELRAIYPPEYYVKNNSTDSKGKKDLIFAQDAYEDPSF